MESILTKVDICEYSDLREDWCAHCLGHKLPPEYEAVAW